jgi:dihydroflavonol-4-reductase
MSSDTVLLTGASGFIAKHILLALLREGYSVRATVRRSARAGEVMDAVRPHLPRSFALEQQLSFHEADLDQDRGWAEAMQGVAAVIHTASPFPLVQPKDEQDVIRPAVEGTLRVLRAANAAGVDRVVLTSSVAAIAYSPLPAGAAAFDERHWTDPDDPAITAYTKSKTLAEKAAWDFVRSTAPRMRLTTINPGLVAGPALDTRIGTSLEVIQRILASKDPALPRIGFLIVDVRDVARLHVEALRRPETEGERVMAAADFMWFADIARALKEAFPERRIVTRQAPNLLIRLLGFFDRSIASILPELGRTIPFSNDKARRLYGFEFIEGRRAVADAARFLIDSKLA